MKEWLITAEQLFAKLVSSVSFSMTSRWMTSLFNWCCHFYSLFKPKKRFLNSSSCSSLKDSKNYPLNKSLVQSCISCCEGSLFICITNSYPLLVFNQYIRSFKKTNDGIGNIFLKLTWYVRPWKVSVFYNMLVNTHKTTTTKNKYNGKKEQANLKIPIKI